MIDRIASVAGVVLLVLASALASLLELSLVPLYLGSYLVPVSVPLALGLNWLLPRLARRLVDAPGPMALILAAWLVPMAGLALTPRPEGDVYVPAGSGVQWVYYATLFGGIVVGVATLVLAAPPGRAARPRRLPPARRVRPQPPGSSR